MKNKLKLLAISCLITAPLTGCGSSDDDEIQVFEDKGSIDYYAPVITINLDENSVTDDTSGITSTEVAVGETYLDAGATALDEIEGDATAAVTMVSTVDTSEPGEYTVTYSVSDSVGNIAELVRTVIVPDTILPEITLNGSDELIGVGWGYTDKHATAYDGFDGDLEANDFIIVSTVDSDTAGFYSVTYNISDAAGNAAIEVVRIVEVRAGLEDNLAPIMSLIGNKVTFTEVGVPFTDEGATATDNIDEDAVITALIEAVSTVDSDVIGDYTITYSVTDGRGNVAVPLVRKVKVIPVIAGVDVIMDVSPQQTLQALKFGATMEFESDLLVSKGITNLISGMITRYAIDTLRLPILASQPVDSPLYANIQAVAAEAKSQGMKIMATVSQSPDGLIDNHPNANWLAEDEKYSAIATCDDCPDNLYNIDLTDYATYLDQYLADMATAGGAVDYIAPFTHDAVSATDYQQLWAAMSGDDDGTVKRVGPESNGIDGADNTYAAVAVELDIAASNFYDEDDLTIDEQQTQWNALNASASSNSSPLWFTELHPLNEGADFRVMVLNGIASMIPAIRAGAERVFFGKQLATHLLWWSGGPASLRGWRLIEFVNGAKGNVVDSTLYSDLIKGVSFRNEDSLTVVFTNNLASPWYTPEQLEADATLADDPNRILATAEEVAADPSIELSHDRVVAVRLQEGETIAADSEIKIFLTGTGNVNNKLLAEEDFTVNDAKNVITFTLPAVTHARVLLELTPVTLP